MSTGFYLLVGLFMLAVGATTKKGDGWGDAGAAMTRFAFFTLLVAVGFFYPYMSEIASMMFIFWIGTEFAVYMMKKGSIPGYIGTIASFGFAFYLIMAVVRGI